MVRSAVGRNSAAMLLVAFAFAMTGFGGTAAGATRYVAETGSGGGSCATPDYTTIGDAIAGSSSGDVIHVCAGTYQRPFSPWNVTGKDLVFQGAGRASTSLTGRTAPGSFGAIFTVTDADVEFHDLTFSANNGASSPAVVSLNSTSPGTGDSTLLLEGVTASGFSSGAAVIQNCSNCVGAITIRDSTISNNQVNMAIDAPSSEVTVSGSTFAGNAPSVAGSIGAVGAAINARSVVISDSTFTGNIGSSGGAIFVRTTATISGSTFADNSAASLGGAIAVFDGTPVGSLTITNSTITNNESGRCTNTVICPNRYGAALVARNITMTNVTVAGNRPPTGLSTVAAVGGTLSMRNSLIVGGADGATVVGCQAGTASNQGGNLVASTISGCSAFATATTEAALINLQALADNGGPTATMAIPRPTVAIDAATSGCPATDQRGQARGTPCDAGAFENVLPARTLAYSATGSGGGAVVSSPYGVDCSADCSVDFDDGATVVLTPTPAAGSAFWGWSGDCVVSGTGCTVTMSAARAVSALFAPPRTLSASVSGTGTITSAPAGIDCGSSCAAAFAGGSTVVLTAAPGAGSTFGGWGGACSGASSTCTVTLTADTSVTATFAAANTSGGGSAPEPAPVPSGPEVRLSAPSRVTMGDAATIVSVLTATSAGRVVQSGSARGQGRVCGDRAVLRSPGRIVLRCSLDRAARRALTRGPLNVRLRTTFVGVDRGVVRSERLVVVRRAAPPEPSRVTG